jgi:hypothetical protein
MGVMTYITLERPIQGLKDDICGRSLARNSLHLDEIATSLGIQPLGSFLSCSAEQAADLMEGDPEASEKMKGFKEEWFTASEGLEAVQRLLDHLRKEPTALPSLEWLDAVLLDLEAATRILETAETHGVRFHFTCAC